MHEAEHIFMDREEFTFPTAKPQWAPPRQYNIEHLAMDWTVDLEEERVDAISTIKISIITPESSRIFLHAAELNISSIRDSNGNELEWEEKPDEQTMFVYLTDTLKQGDKEELTFTYTIERPRAGLHFTKAVPEHPDVETSAWTQLQDDYARHVVPIYDNPSHKFSVETILTVPDGYYAMSNGVLKDRKKNDDGTETFHWLNEKPMPAYLMMCWISEAVEYKEDADGLEVSFYAHPKWDKETVYRSYEKTPDMVKFFVEKLNPFPWDKYAQVTAALFVAGGMENVSATTQTDATFHDEKAHLDKILEYLANAP